MPGKFYVVWKGRRQGIYDTWEEASGYVLGFPGARYRSFSNLEDAQKAYGSDPAADDGPAKPIPDSISVDAACSGNPGPTEYRGVSTSDGRVLFEHTLPWGTNNIGEFLAIVEGLAILQDMGSDVPIYSDSDIAILWVSRKRCTTKLEHTQRTTEAFKRVEEAEDWLRGNDPKNRVIKWNTLRWGEIPADYGRK